MSSDKGHAGIDYRHVIVFREVRWLSGDRRFPAGCGSPTSRASSGSSHASNSRIAVDPTRGFVSSANFSAEQAAEVVRGHWAIENILHWTLDVVFNEDQSCLRKGHGAKNMSIVRHFAFNLARQIPKRARTPNINGKTGKPRAQQKTTLKRRRRIASWNPNYLPAILTAAR